MVYNLTKHLRDKLPAETIYTGQRVKTAGQSVIPARCLLVKESGGTEGPWTQYQVLTVQIIARDVDGPKARALAYLVYDELQGRFGLLLPQATVDGVVHGQVKTAQISAIQVPYDLGPDEEGRTEYVTNYQIIRER